MMVVVVVMMWGNHLLRIYLSFNQTLTTRDKTIERLEEEVKTQKQQATALTTKVSRLEEQLRIQHRDFLSRLSSLPSSSPSSSSSKENVNNKEQSQKKRGWVGGGGGREKKQALHNKSHALEMAVVDQFELIEGVIASLSSFHAKGEV